MKVFDHDGVSLHRREDGDPTGPPVLLLDSLGTDLRLGDGVVPHLSGLRVIRMDTGCAGFEEIPMHIRATTNTGATRQDVMQAFLHVAIHAGVPKANHAIKLAKATHAEMEETHS